MPTTRGHLHTVRMTTRRPRAAAPLRVALRVAPRVALVLVSCVLLSACGASFDPDGDEATRDRAAGDSAAEVLLDEVTAGARPVGTALFDLCTEGQHNWKRHDDYDHECDLAHSRVVAGVQTVDEVEPSLLAMHERILAAGCTVDRGRIALSEVAEVYWPSRRKTSNPSPGILPSGHYSCAFKGEGGLELEVEPYAAGRDERYDLRPDIMLTPYIATRTQRSEPFPASTASTVARSGMALHYVVTAKVAYLVV